MHGQKVLITQRHDSQILSCAYSDYRLNVYGKRSNAVPVAHRIINFKSLVLQAGTALVSGGLLKSLLRQIWLMSLSTLP